MTHFQFNPHTFLLIAILVIAVANWISNIMTKLEIKTKLDELNASVTTLGTNVTAHETAEADPATDQSISDGLASLKTGVDALNAKFAV